MSEREDCNCAHLHHLSVLTGSESDFEYSLEYFHVINEYLVFFCQWNLWRIFK